MARFVSGSSRTTMSPPGYNTENPPLSDWFGVWIELPAGNGMPDNAFPGRRMTTCLSPWGSSLRGTSWITGNSRAPLLALGKGPAAAIRGARTEGSTRVEAGSSCCCFPGDSVTGTGVKSLHSP